MRGGINMSKKVKRKRKDLQAISKPNTQKGVTLKTAGFLFFSNSKFKKQEWKPPITPLKFIALIIALLIILGGGFKYEYL